ncbi:MAG: NAD-glutamate dehydrogenase, partial [Propionibacteriaceae bacterium]|nr:NAD-glutamate dehydrogenase [Propionibacteriaceae bacterium]
MDERKAANELIEECLKANPGTLDQGAWEDLVRAAMAHLQDVSALPQPHNLPNQLVKHFSLALERAQGEVKLDVTTPENGSAPLVATPGSTLVQIVTEDMPFLVDTVSMGVAASGWELRSLHHPQLRVVRKDGRIEGVGKQGEGESWLSLEVYPPLGVSAEDGKEALVKAVRQSVADVRMVVEDWPRMIENVSEAKAVLDADVPFVSEATASLAKSLLEWLVAGNFVFVGYQEFTYAGGQFVPVKDTGLGVQRGDPSPAALSGFHAYPVEAEPQPIVLTKHPQPSPVYRPRYIDYVGVRSFDENGQLVGERRFLGLLAASAYTESVSHIPLLDAKLKSLLDRSGFPVGSYGYNKIWQTVSGYPRDELFDASVSELAPAVTEIAGILERRTTRVFLRRSRYGAFATALVYLPRERLNTPTREAISRILLEEFGGESLHFSTQQSESVLTRLYFVVRLKPDAPKWVDDEVVERRIVEAVRTWEDRVDEKLDKLPAQERGVEFSPAYKDAYPPETAIADLQVANQLVEAGALRYSLGPDADGVLRFKIFSYKPLELHDVLPHLTAMDLQVADEKPFTWELRGRTLYLYDYGLDWPATLPTDDGTLRRMASCFDASLKGRNETDSFNRLVLSGLTWQQAALLRAIARWLRQSTLGFSQSYIASALAVNSGVACKLVDAFRAKFDPDHMGDWEAILDSAKADVDKVSSLDQDRILRCYLSFIRACQRTNVYTGSSVLAFKLSSKELSWLPEPRPMAEIFVYSPRVEGVHLRFGKVARGGLRWSDRAEDYRTEILGLVKAQNVKNTVIVPVGAKGGFYPKQLPDASDRAAWMAEGTESYKLFVTALLSVTDNIVNGEVVTPERVVRHDDEDPYLVVAADKGTASFSDTANAISIAKGFWLGDAFASGGSVGYDHKKMGITARGAWESTKTHLAELGIGADQDFTVVGIGDMSGDVFGNGMLLSHHIQLVAAFDHRHIFLDPNPDAEVSWIERKRLFELPRSSWADYNPEFISAGGGVYSRKVKSVPISAQVRDALGLESTRSLTPAELIHAILKAPVDLLWNGGIGTYVKGSTETNADAGDKANDAIRVNGSEVRARSAVEGGNLGWTQRGRIEYAMAGGKINTDFIDNSAGVDTSDHEVNIKILLADAISAGELKAEDRAGLLAELTDEVANSVLRHNIAQNIGLSNAELRADQMAGSHAGWIRTLVESGYIDRELDSLPTGAQIKERMSAGKGLTRPELAVVLAHTKIALKEWMLATDLPEDPYLADRLRDYFPDPLPARFPDLLGKHRLSREIITTVAVNRFVDSQGI